MGISWIEVSIEGTLAVVISLDFWKLEEVLSDSLQERIILILIWVNGFNEVGVLSNDEISQSQISNCKLIIFDALLYKV